MMFDKVCDKKALFVILRDNCYIEISHLTKINFFAHICL